MSEQLEMLTESPAQWTTVVYVTPEIQKKEIKPFVVLALKELEGNPDSRTSSLMNADKFSAVREVVRHFARLRSATTEPWREEDVKIFLEGLRFSPDCIGELTSLLCTEQIYENIPRHLKVKPGLLSLQWRVDISLCQSNIQADNSNQQRIKELFHNLTCVILTLHLSDGSINTYILSIQKFQELRYVVASALKNMIVLEKRKCMRQN